MHAHDMICSESRSLNLFSAFENAGSNVMPAASQAAQEQSSVVSAPVPTSATSSFVFVAVAVEAHRAPVFPRPVGRHGRQDRGGRRRARGGYKPFGVSRAFISPPYLATLPTYPPTCGTHSFPHLLYPKRIVRSRSLRKFVGNRNLRRNTHRKRLASYIGCPKISEKHWRAKHGRISSHYQAATFFPLPFPSLQHPAPYT